MCVSWSFVNDSYALVFEARTEGSQTLNAVSFVDETYALVVETKTEGSQTLNVRYWCCVSLHNLKITQDSERKAVGIIARNVCKFEVR